MEYLCIFLKMVKFHFISVFLALCKLLGIKVLYFAGHKKCWDLKKNLMFLDLTPSIMIYI